ncbi:unnamed protein product [Nezara viridula]|uniref:Uncharacterized protein n=1 Tax=Nezara viridula TaxID=85310 RepID=A0A9P0H2C0_NEZVI|nr:unnamed protein product [Nezara viridula]
MEEHLTPSIAIPRWTGKQLELKALEPFDDFELIAMPPAGNGAPQNDVIFKFSTIVCLFPFKEDGGSRLAFNRLLLVASFIFTSLVLLVGLGAIYDFLPRYKGNIFLQGLIFIYMSCYLSIYP